MKKYKCMNIGNCDFANTGEEFEIPEGETIKCPKCQKEDMVVEVKETPWKKIAAICGGIVGIAAICGGIYALTSGSNPKIEKITLDQKELMLEVGHTEKLTASVEPEGTEATFVWSSNSENITVSDGRVTAVNPTMEPAIVTVSVEGNSDVSAVCRVTVKEKLEPVGKDDEPQETLIQSIALVEQSITLKEGETKQVALTIQPEKNDESVTYVSSDEKVATVSEDGVITAIKEGTAQITATTDKSDLKAVVEVKVTKKAGKVQDSGNGWGKENLGYGVYEGYRKNHKPHGHGVIKYTRSHQIVSWKNFTASPGDTFEGEFRDGKISGLGYWKHNGNVTAIQ